MSAHRRRSGWLPAAVLFSLLPASAWAVEQDPGIWTTFSTADGICRNGRPTRWRYWFDAQARFFGIGSDASQYVLRPGVGYDIGDNLTAWVGIGRFYVHTAEGDKATETRYWQQLS